MGQYQPLSSGTFVVSHVSELKHSKRGDPYVECETDRGLVAFWGGDANEDNIERVSVAARPFRITCQCFEPGRGRHSVWVPQTARILSIEPTTATASTAPAEEPVGASISASQLGEWRRELIRILNAIEGPKHTTEDEGLAGRIARLSRSGRIPREVAAFMRTVTEMRNTTEYEAKVLTPTEDLAVTSAWRVVTEWAKKQDFAPKAPM